MSQGWKDAMASLVILAGILVGGACYGDSPGSASDRLWNQKHNRMILIKVEGKEPLYVDLPKHYDAGSPAISPDGKQIAFDAIPTGEHQPREVWLVGVDGKGLHRIGKGMVPRWSPDGKRLLHTVAQPVAEGTTTDEDFHLVDVTLESGKSLKICDGHFGDWSPDGRRLAFSRGGSWTQLHGTLARASIYLAKPNGGDTQELGEGDRPSWSPDGKKIACCLDNERQPPTIWIIDVATKKRVRLGIGFYQANWAGDGKSVFVNSLLFTAGGTFSRVPARLWLDKDRLEFFALSYDVPFSPCVSRDGKTLVLILDSKERE